MAHDTSPPGSVLDTIDTLAAKTIEMREAAALLTSQVTEFRDFLTTLKGRTEAVTWVGHPDANDDFILGIGVKFHRVDKEWQLSCGTSMMDDPDDPVTWTPLATAPLDIKIEAVKAFPALLTAMVDYQEKVVKKVAEASKFYSSFAKQLGITSKPATGGKRNA